MKQLGLAVANYHDHYHSYPPAYFADAEGRPMHSWRVLLLPFLDAGDLYRQYDFSQPWDSPHNRRLEAQMPRVYAFHGEHRPGLTTTNYLAVVGQETAWPGTAVRDERSITDGTASTILIVENLGAGVHWMEPRDLSFANMSFEVGDPAAVSSKYKNPAIVTLAGQVLALEKDMAPETLRAMLTADGGEDLRVTADQTIRLKDGRDRE